MKTIRRVRRRRSEGGQAMLEILPVAVLILTMTFAVIDLGRAILQIEVLCGLSREGSNIASRSNSATGLASVATTVLNDGANINLPTSGAVILTCVQNNGGALTITGQVKSGPLTVTSRVGTGVGNAATLPLTSPVYPATGGTAYVTEVFSSYTPITPVGVLAKLALPSHLYDIAYF